MARSCGRSSRRANSGMPITTMGEGLGTLVLILMGNAVVANVVLPDTKGHQSGWIVVTAGWAFAVLCGVLVALALGATGELNPAVTLANVIVGTRTAGDATWHIAAQLVGAMLGQLLVWLAYLAHWPRAASAAERFACFATTPAIRAPAANVLTEAIGTFVLVFVATAIGTHGVSGATPATNLGPAFVAALVWGIGLGLGGPTGYAINPARDLGPRLVHQLLPLRGKGSSEWSYAWIPIAGPLLGAAAAAWLWSAVAPR